MEAVEKIEIRDPYGFIYITTNLINGKRYLGQKTFKDRGWKGYLGSGKAFKAALDLYKKENFRREIIHICYSEEELNNAEYELSVFFNVVKDPDWYNMVYGGGSTAGWHHSEELKQEQSERAKKQWEDEEYRRKHVEYGKTLIGEKNPNYGNHKLSGENNPNYGKHASEETRKKISEANSNPSEETRNKMSEAAKARCTDEWKEYLREINTGRHPTEESRAKMSKSQSERWTDELRAEWSVKLSGEGNPMYGRHHSEETKAMLSEMFSGENGPMYGTHPSEETLLKMSLNSPLRKEVIQFTMDGIYVSEYHSMCEAERVTGILESQICTAAKTHKSAGGYLWRIKGEYNPDEVVKYVNETLIPVVQVGLDGSYVAEYVSGKEAERQTGILAQNIGKCCKEKHCTAGGYFWRTTDEYNPNEIFKYKPHERAVVQLDLDGSLIAEYSSIANASRATGFHPSSIRNCCCNPNKTLYGYKWMYLEDYEQYKNNK